MMFCAIITSRFTREVERAVESFCLVETFVLIVFIGDDGWTRDMNETKNVDYGRE